MTLEEIGAHIAIRQTIHSYNIAGDSRNAALFCDQFADDAVFEFADAPPLPGFRHVGIEAIRNMAANWIQFPVTDPKLTPVSFIRHNITTCRVELTGPESAKARTYAFVVTDIGPDHAVNYTDDFVRRDGRWLFAHRRIVLDWRDPGSVFPPMPR